MHYRSVLYGLLTVFGIVILAGCDSLLSTEKYDPSEEALEPDRVGLLVFVIDEDEIPVSGAEVWIGNDSLGVTREDGILDVDSLTFSDKSATISVLHDNFAPWQKTINTGAEDGVDIRAQLEEDDSVEIPDEVHWSIKAVDAETGEPISGATILRGEEEIGSTPFSSLVQLEKEFASLRIQADGYKTHQVYVASFAPQEIVVELIPAEPTESRVILEAKHAITNEPVSGTVSIEGILSREIQPKDEAGRLVAKLDTTIDGLYGQERSVTFSAVGFANVQESITFDEYVSHTFFVEPLPPDSVTHTYHVISPDDSDDRIKGATVRVTNSNGNLITTGSSPLTLTLPYNSGSVNVKVEYRDKVASETFATTHSVNADLLLVPEQKDAEDTDTRTVLKKAERRFKVDGDVGVYSHNKKVRLFDEIELLQHDDALFLRAGLVGFYSGRTKRQLHENLSFIMTNNRTGNSFRTEVVVDPNSVEGKVFLMADVVGDMAEDFRVGDTHSVDAIWEGQDTDSVHITEFVFQYMYTVTEDVN